MKFEWRVYDFGINSDSRDRLQYPPQPLNGQAVKKMDGLMGLWDPLGFNMFVDS